MEKIQALFWVLVGLKYVSRAQHHSSDVTFLDFHTHGYRITFHNRPPGVYVPAVGSSANGPVPVFTRVQQFVHYRNIICVQLPAVIFNNGGR